MSNPTDAIDYHSEVLMSGVHSRTRDKMSSLRNLASRGLTPTVMLDVGAHLYGTPDFYDIHPDVKHLIFEPVQEFAKALEKICAQYRDMELIVAAVSNYSGETDLEVLDGLSHSNINPGYLQAANSRLTRKVPVVTLDQVIAERDLQGPFWLKVDVDGHDEQVLEGAVETLKQTEVVVFEADVDNVSFRMKFMEERGFYLWDLVELHYHTNSLYFFDMIFLPERLRDARFRDWLAS